MLWQAIGAELDLSDKGLGIRSRRFALLADDGVVSHCSHFPAKSQFEFVENLAHAV